MPRDCTESPKWLLTDVQSPCHRVSHTMTNKNNRKVRVVAPKKQQQKKKKPTPFGDVGDIVGSKVSTMFGAPWAKGVGRWLGTGIGQIFGSGDYQMVGSQPGYNVLTNGNQIPKFSTTAATNVISHREYLGDITGTSGFNLSSYPLNPGISRTFPWLSTLAQNFQEYKFHGLIFEFRPLITDFVTGGAPGVVVMATNYNSDASAYTTKQEMENSEYAVSVKPTREMIHGVECATNQTVLNQLYVRTGAPASGQDLRLYDIGLFQFATQANPIQNLGELWVSYSVEFFKPVLPQDVGGNIRSNHSVRTSTASGSPFGLVGVSNRGDLGLVVNATSMSWDANPGNYYLVTFTWTGSVAAVALYPTFTLTGCAYVPFWTPGASQFITVPGAATTTTSMSIQFVVLVSNTSSLAQIDLLVGGTLPSGATTFDAAVTGWSTEGV